MEVRSASFPPYDLRANGSQSQSFYTTLSEFARWPSSLDAPARHLLQEYSGFLRRTGRETPRSSGEYAIEFLTIGLLWRRYLGASQHAPGPAVALLRALAAVRRASSHCRPLLDPIRGLMAALFLHPGIGSPPKEPGLSLRNLDRLMAWLDASGEFADELKRMRNWREFLGTLRPEQVVTSLQTSLDLLRRFAAGCTPALAPYTSRLESFLRNSRNARAWREDRLLRGKTECEYHLNMIASEIMNHALQDDFRHTQRRVVLVPGCMRQLPEGRCRADTNGNDIVCTGCTPSCNVNRIRGLGLQHGFEVYIIPHSTSFTRWLRPWRDNADCGIVAVACALNIAAGGYQMRELNIRSQCVILDYPGCKRHWHPDGVPTSVNEDRLLSLVTLRPS